MLDKIKEVIGVADKIKEVSTAVEVHNQKVQQLQEQLNKLQEIIASMSSAQSKALNEVQHVLDQTRQSMESVGDVKKKLEDEVYQFRMLKGQLQNKLIDKFDQELSSELKRNTEEIGIHANNFSKALQEGNRFSTALLQTTNELQKWLVISKKIQEKDFDMTKTARQLIAYGEDKKALIQKVEMLERLVGKLRRNSTAKSSL